MGLLVLVFLCSITMVLNFYKNHGVLKGDYSKDVMYARNGFTNKIGDVSKLIDGVDRKYFRKMQVVNDDYLSSYHLNGNWNIWDDIATNKVGRTTFDIMNEIYFSIDTKRAPVVIWASSIPCNYKTCQYVSKKNHAFVIVGLVKKSPIAIDGFYIPKPLSDETVREITDIRKTNSVFYSSWLASTNKRYPYAVVIHDPAEGPFLPLWRNHYGVPLTPLYVRRLVIYAP